MKKARAGSLAPLRAARDGANAPFCTTRAASGVSGGAGSITFPSRCLLRSHSRDAFRARVEGRGGARVVPRSLVGDAINVIISIDCSKAHCGSGGVEAPPIGARTEDDKGSGLSLRIIELRVVPRSANFFLTHSAVPSRRGLVVESKMTVV